jgi:hypothetical protein
VCQALFHATGIGGSRDAREVREQSRLGVTKSRLEKQQCKGLETKLCLACMGRSTEASMVGTG